jgi:type III secretion protein R
MNLELISGSQLAGWVILLALLALAPFVLAMVTSFVKIVIVTSMIRTALGTPQIPPNIVITGLAMILSVHVMWPVGVAISDLIQERLVDTPPYEQAVAPAEKKLQAEPDRLHRGAAALEAAILGPLHDFLSKNADPNNRNLFESLRKRLADDKAKPRNPQPIVQTATVLVPAFVLTELTEAFQIGFLIFIPFLIIDLVVSNILMALGMHYLQPTIISMPMKLLLFVVVDGWSKVIQGLLLSYA